MRYIIQRLPSRPLGYAERFPGHETNCSVCLPRVDTAADELSPTRAFKPGHGHMLFVDAEESLVDAVRELLEMLGYQVTACASNLDALEMFRAAPERYDVVISDQTMPNLTGKELAREILQIRPDLPILLCRGFSHTMTEEKARELGM